jgi:predicted SnoaL-like aldol condensation-catalyzing enzyme
MKRIILLIVFSVFSVSALAQYPVPQQSPTLAMNEQERANLEFVEAFWRDIVNGGNLDIATHYMRDAFIETLRTNPSLVQNRGLTTPEVILAQDEYVFFMWASFIINPMDAAIIYKYNTIDLFRVDGGKIVEHWDGAHKVLDTDVGAKNRGGGTYSTPSNFTAQEQETLRIGQIEFRDILQFGHAELALEYFAPGYMQHNMNVPGGLEGFMGFFGGRQSQPLTGEWITPPTLELVSGNYYLKFDQRFEDAPSGGQNVYYRFDMVRVDDGLIQEHWDVAFPRGIASPNGGLTR